MAPATHQRPRRQWHPEDCAKPIGRPSPRSARRRQRSGRRAWQTRSALPTRPSVLAASSSNRRRLLPAPPAQVRWNLLVFVLTHCALTRPPLWYCFRCNTARRNLTLDPCCRRCAATCGPAARGAFHGGWAAHRHAQGARYLAQPAMPCAATAQSGCQGQGSFWQIPQERDRHHRGGSGACACTCGCAGRRCAPGVEAVPPLLRRAEIVGLLH